MIFHFVVKRLRWLAHVPGAPQFFDALLLLHTALFHRVRLAALETLENLAIHELHLEARIHHFGGTAFVSAGHEVAHFHGNGLLDAKVGRSAATVLVSEGRAAGHHVLGNSAWVSLWVEDSSDLPGASALLRAALLQRERQAREVLPPFSAA